MRTVQELIEDNPDRRIDFQDIKTEEITANPNYLLDICFTD